jgi:KipI family sensor histidine kinase inhibitor
MKQREDAGLPDTIRRDPHKPGESPALHELKAPATVGGGYKGKDAPDRIGAATRREERGEERSLGYARSRNTIRDARSADDKRKKARAGAKAGHHVPYTLVDMPTPVDSGARFQPASDRSLLIYFGQQITLEAHQRVIRLLRLMELQPVAGIHNLHPAYCSLLVTFDALKLRHDELQAILRGYLDRLEDARLPEPRQLEIPVCYGGEHGPDLDEVAALHGMSPAQAIELHSSVTYVVYFLGFVPGFAYLGELPEALATPRLVTPRKSVPPGSIGIAGNQTGVYPFATPGGWRLIGRTPFSMFQPDRKNMSLLSIGDRVRFMPASKEQFTALENA